MTLHDAQRRGEQWQRLLILQTPADRRNSLHEKLTISFVSFAWRVLITIPELNTTQFEIGLQQR